MRSSGKAAGAGWNEKVAEGREHVDEPLQPSGRSKALPRPFSPVLAGETAEANSPPDC